MLKLGRVGRAAAKSWVKTGKTSGQIPEDLKTIMISSSGGSGGSGLRGVFTKATVLAKKMNGDTSGSGTFKVAKRNNIFGN